MFYMAFVLCQARQACRRSRYVFRLSVRLPCIYLFVCPLRNLCTRCF